MSTLSPTDAAAFGKVGVLYGGRSAEREISILSGTGVLQALKSRGIDAHGFDPAERTLAELAALAAIHYLDRRSPEISWREPHPRLSKWFDERTQDPRTVRALTPTKLS